MNEASSDPVLNDVVFNILSEKLSDEDIRRIFACHGKIQFSKSTNNTKKLKTEEQIVINFRTRSDLLRNDSYVHETRGNQEDSAINSLPDNCLIHILSFLPIRDQCIIAQVCKRWRNISNRVFAETKELDLQRYMPDNVAHCILKQCGPFIEKLKLQLDTECKRLLMVIQFCQLHQLTEIHLNFSSPVQSELCLPYLTELLENSAENLVHLEIRGDVMIDHAIDQITLLHPQNLKILRIWDLERNKWRALKIDLDFFPNLRELSCKNITILKNEKKMNPEILTNFESLELWENGISRNFIENIKFCKNLRKLILDDNYCQIIDDDIFGIVKNCQKIQELHLDGSFVLTPRHLQALGKMPSLEILRIRSLGIANTLHLKHLTNLKELTIDCCKRLTEYNGFIQLITNSPKLSSLSLLNAFMLDQSFIERVSDIFNHGWRKTPISLEVEGERYTWSAKYDPDSEDLGMKIEISRNLYDSDDSLLENINY